MYCKLLMDRPSSHILGSFQLGHTRAQTNTTSFGQSLWITFVLSTDKAVALSLNYFQLHQWLLRLSALTTLQFPFRLGISLPQRNIMGKLNPNSQFPQCFRPSVCPQTRPPLFSFWARNGRCASLPRRELSPSSPWRLLNPGGKLKKVMLQFVASILICDKLIWGKSWKPYSVGGSGWVGEAGSGGGEGDSGAAGWARIGCQGCEHSGIL